METSKLRVLLTHRPRGGAGGFTSGLTEIEAWARTDLPLPKPTAPVPDLAVGARVTASFTSRYDDPAQVNDLRIAFTRYSRNRWTAYGSPNRRDWLEFDLGTPRTVRQLDLYLWGDSAGVRAPRDYRIEYWDGTGWLAARVENRAPARPATWAVNTVRIAPVTTGRLRIVFEHDLPGVSGVTEVMIWDERP